MSAWSDAVAATSPHGWWKLNEASGSVASDSSGNGRHGSYQQAGDLTYGAASLIPGSAGDLALTVTGTLGTVSAPTTGLSTVGVTYAATVRSSASPAGGLFVAATSTFLSFSSTITSARIDTSNQIDLGYAPSNLLDGVAHFVVYVVRAATVELWVDGAMVSSKPHAAAGAALSSFTLTQQFSGPTGTYDDMLVWGSALSSSQIGSLSSAWSGSAPGVPARSADLAGSGVLTVSVVGVHSVAAALAGSGALTADAGTPVRSADLSGSGVLTATTTSALLPQTDTTNRVGGRMRSGYGIAEWAPAVVTTPSHLTPATVVAKAAAYGPVTMQGARPTFTVSEAEIPRHRQRVLVGGKDVTYFRDVATPFVDYQLADPLLWGPARIEFPQIASAFERPGVGALKWLKFGKPVVVQRVDAAGNVVGTDYRGVIVAFDAAGSGLSVECGGHAQGRAALREIQTPIFHSTRDVGRLAWRALGALGLTLKPRMGPVTGVEVGRTGGMDHLDYIRDLCSKAQTKAGKRWTITPNDSGVYRMVEKDTTTVAFTLFCDDARVVANLRRDMAEEPNRIFVTGVTPEGRRVRFGAYPGLKHGPAPAYPFTDGRSFGAGTTNADTHTGDGIVVLTTRLRHTGYLSTDDAPGGYDNDATRAIRHLQGDADLAETGNVNPATWEALFDLNVTGYSLTYSQVMPAAQRSRVRRWKVSASGATVGQNPNYDRHALKVDRTVDMGTGFTRGQLREWARDELADSTLPNWVGTIAVNTGAVLKGKIAVGAAVTAADVMDVRDVRPGMNVWLPQFDGGTLLHVSGVDVKEDSTTLTVDTRARDALEVWQVIERNRETRNSPQRAWRRGKSSTEAKDSIDVWDEVGGILYGDVPLVQGWNVVPVVAGQAGTIQKLRFELSDKIEFACAVFGKRVSPKRLNHLIESPLTKAGTEKWEKRAVRKTLEEDLFLRYSAGTKDEPCGYSPGRKQNDEGNRSGHPLRGVHRDDAGFSYLTPPGRPVLYVAVWVGSATKLRKGRVMWPQLEAGV